MTASVDIAIVGCGPAGLSAAINVKVRRKTLILHGVEFCTPKLHKAPTVDNYLGFPGATGPHLRDAFFRHADAMGVQVVTGKVTSVVPAGDGFILATSHDTFEARAVIIATGVASATYLPGEKEFLGRGVSYCATCDGALFRDRVVAVIGRGGEAQGEAAFLAESCRKVFWLGTPGEAPEAPNVEVVTAKPQAILGEDRVQRLETSECTLEVDGVFLLREVTPAAQLVPGLALQEGAIAVDRLMRTNVPGIYAAGDCTGRPYQLAKAVGEGQIAALTAVKYLD